MVVVDFDAVTLVNFAEIGRIFSALLFFYAFKRMA